MYTYLLLNILTIAGPLALSFHNSLRFYQQFKYFLPSIGITSLVFILWDILFTYWGVWGFNPSYLMGVNWANLPMEEWMFFICIPYACLFSHASLNFHFRYPFFEKSHKAITWILAIALLSISLVFYDRAYTFTTFFFTGLFLLLQALVIKGPYMAKFYFSYLLTLIPFFIVNGILTGACTEKPIVWYNDAENLGIRLYTIPIEDSMYGMFMLLLSLSLWHAFTKGKSGFTHGKWS